jgi:hypothetical protein
MYLVTRPLDRMDSVEEGQVAVRLALVYSAARARVTVERLKDGPLVVRAPLRAGAGVILAAAKAELTDDEASALAGALGL